MSALDRLNQPKWTSQETPSCWIPREHLKTTEVSSLNILRSNQISRTVTRPYNPVTPKNLWDLALDQPLLLLSTRNLTSCSNKPKKSMHSSCANSPLQQISRTWPAVLLPIPQQLLLPTLVYPAAASPRNLCPAAALKSHSCSCCLTNTPCPWLLPFKQPAKQYPCLLLLLLAIIIPSSWPNQYTTSA